MKKDSCKKILLVEDDRLFQAALNDFLEDTYELISANSAEEAQTTLRKGLPDLVLLDVNLPQLGGIEFLKRIKTSRPNLPVIMVTAVDQIPKVVECVRLGAYDYLTKPIDSQTLLMTIERALESSEMRREVEQRRELQLEKNRESEIIGNSPSINRIRKEIEIVGKSDATVLIEGETGTGKELVARAVHAHSPRAEKPFVAINCGAIPKDLVESELFGHKKGAFTGAQKDQIGKFQLAHSGTLLLDEIGELPIYAQIKLLRVLEQYEFYPVGGNELVKVNVRILASTNRNLREMVDRGDFREDLYFRLNIYSIVIPPLRERPKDIIALAKHFLKQYNIKFGKHFEDFSDEAKEILMQYSWKGNVRELQNLIERVVLFEDDQIIQPEHLDFLRSPGQGQQARDASGFRLPDGGIDMVELEKSLLLQALERARFNKSRAAKLLNLSPPTFYYRLGKYDLNGGE